LTSDMFEGCAFNHFNIWFKFTNKIIYSQSNMLITSGTKYFATYCGFLEEKSDCDFWVMTSYSSEGEYRGMCHVHLARRKEARLISASTGPPLFSHF
jgi:hypothetical protein